MADLPELPSLPPVVLLMRLAFEPRRIWRYRFGKGCCFDVNIEAVWSYAAERACKDPGSCSCPVLCPYSAKIAPYANECTPISTDYAISHRDDSKGHEEHAH